MNQIERYPLPGDGEVYLPAGARIMKLDLYHGKVNVWASVDPDQPLKRVVFFKFRTGDPVSDAMVYINSVIYHEMEGGEIVDHYFLSV